MSGQPLRIALLADYREEGWPSMDLVAEQTVAALSNLEDISVELVCPRLPLRARSLSSSGAARNLDRLAGRFLDYPRHLRSLCSSFDLFHILDHSYSQLVHALPPGRSFVTCHDMDTFRCLHEPGREPRPWWFRQMTARIWSGLQAASHVICVSRQTLGELLTAGGGPSSRLSVVHNGTAAEYFAPPSPSARVWLENWFAEQGSGFSLAQDYFLHVGSGIARKRIPFLLRLFAELQRNHPKLWLLRVGGALDAEQAQLAAELGIAARIVTLPFIDRAHLRVLYEEASALLQTSSYEGFGLPVTEALACGCPVVASDIPIYREVGGEVVYYCPLEGLDSWVRQCREILELRTQSSPRLAQRIIEGRSLSHNFQWFSVGLSLREKYWYFSKSTGIR